MPTRRFARGCAADSAPGEVSAAVRSAGSLRASPAHALAQCVYPHGASGAPTRQLLRRRAAAGGAVWALVVPMSCLGPEGAQPLAASGSHGLHFPARDCAQGLLLLLRSETSLPSATQLPAPSASQGPPQRCFGWTGPSVHGAAQAAADGALRRRHCHCCWRCSYEGEADLM